MPYGNRKSGGKGYQSATKKTTKSGSKSQTSGAAGQKKTYRMTGKAPGQGTKRKS